jgi:predicted DNA-binding transcriptional regulator AlpA
VARKAAVSDPNSRIVRVRDLGPQYGLSNQTVSRWEADGWFPRRRPFGPNIVGGWRHELESALEAVGDVVEEMTREREDAA